MLKKVFIIIIIALIVIAGVFGYLTVSGQNQLLEREAKKIGAQSARAAEVDMNLYCRGDYMAVEDTMKTYVRSYIEKLGALEGSLQEEPIFKMLGIDNIRSDGPDFSESRAYLEEKRTQIEDLSKELVNLSKAETALDAIRDEAVGYLPETLYTKYMQGIVDAGFFCTDSEINAIRDNLLASLSSIEKVVDFLRSNAGKWSVENNVLTFEDDQLLGEYQKLAAEIK